MADPHKIHDFHGGLHIPDHKAESNADPIRSVPLPPRLILPLHQHIGEPAEPLVQLGDQVRKGQPIALASGYVSAGLHAPTSGRVVEIGDHPIAHPSGLSAPCIVIEPDGEDRWAELPAPLTNYTDVEDIELRERIRWAGIVGLGGAAFPTSVKVNSTAQRQIDTLIINGAECEPYITCDDRQMREQAPELVEGIAILLHLIGAHRCLVGIEDNKPEAIAAVRKAVADAGRSDTEVVAVPTKYPSGGEKQLIQLLTGMEVPSNGLPGELGILCQNVGTTVAVADAVLRGRPLIARVVTVTGQGIARPGNFTTLLGTPADWLIAQAGGYTPLAARLILGGPMMGFTLANDQLPLTKGGNCLLVASSQELPPPPPAGPCIRCGDCVRACPALLLPQQMYWHARARDFDKVQDYHLFDCIECGCCAHVCPAHIPLVQYYRFAKTQIWAAERERRKSDLARRRHEARIARLERLEAERKAKLRQKKEVLDRTSGASAADPKKAAIAAAMRRVAEKKATQATEQESASE